MLSNADRARALALSAVVDKEHMLRVMDNLIEDMQVMRAQIASEDGANGKDSALAKRLEKARQDRETWFAQLQEAEWGMEGEGIDLSLQGGGLFGQLFGTMKPRTRRRKDEEKT